MRRRRPAGSNATDGACCVEALGDRHALPSGGGEQKHVKTTNKWRKAFDAIHRDVSIDDTALVAAVRAPRPRVDLLTGELNP